MALLCFLRTALRLAGRGGWLALVLGCLAGSAMAASAAPADSLRQALRAAPNDTTRVKLALRLSAALLGADTAQAGHYARQALALSRLAKYDYGLAYGWLQLCTLALVRHDNTAAARYGARAQAVANALYRHAPAPRLRQLLVGIANNRGNVADYQGRYAAVITHYLQAADLLSQAGDRHALLTVYGNLGNDFQVLKQPAQAAHYWRQAVALGSGPPPTPELLTIYIQLAELHISQAQPDSAWRVLAAARPIAPGHLYQGEYYGTLGQYYALVGQVPAARQAYRQALPYLARKGAAGYQAQLLLGLGQLETVAGNLPQARRQLQRALALIERLGDPQQQLTALDALAQFEAADSQWQPALRYTQRAQHLRDSLAGTAVHQQINQLETRFRTRQQAQQLVAARQAEAAQRAALRQQRRLNAAYLALLALLVASGGLGLLLLRHRRRLARQARTQENALLTTQAMLQGQDQERQRLARDLHDGLGGMLATVKLYLSSIRTRGSLPPESTALFTQSIDHLDSAVAELRRVARNLMPEALLSFGLAPALHDLCQAVQQTGSVQVQLTTHGLTPRLPAATEVELYRMVQELLNNALRHAQARQVLVQLMRHDDSLHLVVEDDGRGFDPRASATGVGLRSVQARAGYLGGQLEVQSEPGQGTSISLELHLPPPAATAAPAGAAAASSPTAFSFLP